jgi:hypothetical protein
MRCPRIFFIPAEVAFLPREKLMDKKTFRVGKLSNAWRWRDQWRTKLV